MGGIKIVKITTRIKLSILLLIIGSIVISGCLNSKTPDEIADEWIEENAATTLSKPISKIISRSLPGGFLVGGVIDSKVANSVTNLEWKGSSCQKVGKLWHICSYYTNNEYDILGTKHTINAKMNLHIFKDFFGELVVKEVWLNKVTIDGKSILIQQTYQENPDDGYRLL